ncbi:MAG: geranylgeranylglyceryl/heptaprenylglyceryl phosphate synthase [candidate division KSB1 bacterium]|nr:geranylgeranylglyceryl/heptaprenylglyceryl phosphate synthase [candidate division KSB1 bacterium]MDZ7385982.1 geranylgeranylglyceryl/heptaprenylglyceryl phosphate synthase [candidate division KSB1 bacterium]MDZ7391755.1 geranylgeranylglyceryl/heptaprenylglyceryl phosphate synthase [candidate division KSB1 bacterium]
MRVYDYLMSTRERRGAGYLVLFDPDKEDVSKAAARAEYCQQAGVDALLVGGSLLLTPSFEDLLRELKKRLSIPVIIFPGGVRQVSPHADAILFMSLVSGRNAEHLIGDQVVAAPLVKACGLEPIPTAYMLIESGQTTSAEYMSNTRPIPRHKPDIAAATALAAQYLGMKLVYLEAGSGAAQSVPAEMIRAVSSYVAVPVMVGGGITSPEEARLKVEAGASFVVTGNVLEQKADWEVIRHFAQAVHVRG